MTELERIEGLLVGQLTNEELMFFDKAVRRGEALRSYEWPAGLFGLATVRITDVVRGPICLP